jgi:hypothetical protein
MDAIEQATEVIQKLVNKNQEIWMGIHDCISTNDLERLKTLLSKHTINSFYLSEDGDLILHSAARSNNVKMIEFVLQRISPSTREKMIKMKNNHGQLPADLLTRMNNGHQQSCIHYSLFKLIACFERSVFSYS